MTQIKTASAIAGERFSREPKCLGARGLLVAAAALITLWRPSYAPAEETVFLQSGEQYQADVKGVKDGTLLIDEKGRERSVPAGEVQRIEFQKAREFDGIDSTDALIKASPLFADALAVETQDLQARYPQAGHVVLLRDLVFKVAADGSYTAERTTVWRILDQRAADTSFQAMYFFPKLRQASVVFGITVGPDGTIERVSDSAIKIEAVYPSYPEYNHQQRLRFAMKNPVPGATLFLRTRSQGKATDLLPAVVDETFWSDEPALEKTVRLEADAAAMKNISIATSGDIRADEGGTVWRLKDTPQIFDEPLMPPMQNIAPRLLIAFPASPWEDLAREFAARVDAAPVSSPAGTTPKDVYDKVRRDIRTINVPQDALPVPPAAPGTVLRRGYGTEVEKALLLEAMLKGIGAKASAVLVRGRGPGELLTSAPRLLGFNHALVRLDNADGSATWLQPDVTKRGFGELGPDAQGGKGLDLRSGAIIDVPVLALGADSTTRTVEVTLATDGSAVVKDAIAAAGYDAYSLRRLGDLTEEELRKWAAEYAGSTLPGVSLTDFATSDFARLNPVETVSFTYSVPKLAEISDKFLLLRLPNAEYSPSEVGRTMRQFPLFWSGRDSMDVTFTVHAPEGYAAYAVGRSIDKSGDGWSLKSGYAMDGDSRGTVVFKETWRRETLDAPKDAYQAYRQALITRGILRDEMIVFEKGT